MQTLRNKIRYASFFAIALIFVTTLTLFITAGVWLNTNELPKKAEYLIILGGEPLRTLYAAELFNNGFSKGILLSRPARESLHKRLRDIGISIQSEDEVNHLILDKKNIPKDHIQYFSINSISTLHEAKELAQFYANHPKSTFLIVTSPYHTFHTRLLFSKYIPNELLTVVGNPHEEFPKKWWTNQESARAVLLELAKITFYMIGGSFTDTNSI